MTILKMYFNRLGEAWKFHCPLEPIGCPNDVVISHYFNDELDVFEVSMARELWCSEIKMNAARGLPPSKVRIKCMQTLEDFLKDRKFWRPGIQFLSCGGKQENGK